MVKAVRRERGLPTGIGGGVFGTMGGNGNGVGKADMGVGLTRRTFSLALGAGMLALVSGCVAPDEETTAAPAEPDPQPEPEPTTVEAEPEEPTVGEEQDVSEQAADEKPFEFFDMHADTIGPLAMADYSPYAGFSEQHSGSLVTNNCQIAADRLSPHRWVQCFASWIPDNSPDISHHGWYRREADWFHQQMNDHADLMQQARSFADITGILDAGRLAAILTVENAACLDDGIEVVDEFVEDGVLIAGITWNGQNVLASGNQTEAGFSDLGRSYIFALESRGIVVDVSHLNDTGFWELEAMATRPYIATHSNARSVCWHSRNLTDDMFRALTARGGIVGLNYERGFVTAEGGDYTFDQLCAHVEHWLDLGGENNIAFGSDRDGSSIPSWLADCTAQQPLFDQFSERLGETIARKLFFENAMSFFLAYERASQSGASS